MSTSQFIESIAKAVSSSDINRLQLLELQQVIQINPDGSVTINLGYGAKIESRKGEVIITTLKDDQLQSISISDLIP